VELQKQQQQQQYQQNIAGARRKSRFVVAVAGRGRVFNDPAASQALRTVFVRCELFLHRQRSSH